MTTALEPTRSFDWSTSFVITGWYVLSGVQGRFVEILQDLVLPEQMARVEAALGELS